ncbi:hypothetical protein [Leptolyngbya sp. FACHB-711]|uniref:hypothetical protein n=1 Tax=unclassified Leptolyngbya TaxID=2650499 RepID=UPI001685947A|nr:hypothetical protein [Leptolyngbya sp. FACHB-711]MBD1850929.1 hypothetical protein [Cyanobacteria bacterium FACHB-502]MBD2024015.1 hypothetical protein [Leptolyngbya sp. FACHB-711]
MNDITGTWLGTYWQDGNPTRFEATFVQGGNTLSGRILDDGMLGEAQVTGDLVGRRIQFTKQYLTSSPQPIQYQGTLSEDGNTMSGKWNIGRRYSGSWEAHRNDNDLMASLQARLTKSIPVGADR